MGGGQLRGGQRLIGHCGSEATPGPCLPAQAALVVLSAPSPAGLGPAAGARCQGMKPSVTACPMSLAPCALAGAAFGQSREGGARVRQQTSGLGSLMGAVAEEGPRRGESRPSSRPRIWDHPPSGQSGGPWGWTCVCELGARRPVFHPAAHHSYRPGAHGPEEVGRGLGAVRRRPQPSLRAPSGRRHLGLCAEPTGPSTLLRAGRASEARESRCPSPGWSISPDGWLVNPLTEHGVRAPGGWLQRSGGGVPSPFAFFCPQ